jgi:hypothetical protein
MANAEESPFWRRAWAWTARRRWWIALGVLFALVWWLVPPLLYRHTGTGQDAKLKAITDTRTALLAGLVGVGALLTFWLNSRVYRISAETLRVTEQGHIAERYTKAIEQLGSDKLDIRLGGIYALERIARDSERDHPTVVEVLSAFVREHIDPAHTDSEPSIAKVPSTFLQGESEPAAERHPDAKQPSGKRKLTTDVRAALTVLSRLPSRQNMDRADLSEAHFADVDLQGTNLSGFGFIAADLRGAWLMRAQLRGAHLAGVSLEKANLWSANLHGANLFWANLEGVHLRSANLQQAVLASANLRGANLQEAVLVGADLRCGFAGSEPAGGRLDWRTRAEPGTAQ